MERLRIDDLHAWASSPDRKPLVIRGARQVGKSWLVREFGQRRFASVVEANLERRPDLHACFADRDPRRILGRLEILLRTPIPVDGSAVLFIDEIQAHPAAFAQLRWFYEELPHLPVIAAGSLLDVALADHAFSMPVGRVSFLHLEPMGFLEFCQALDESALVRWLQGLTWTSVAAGGAIDPPIHAHALDLYRVWLLVGGMPGVVEIYRRSRTFLDVARAQRELMASFRDDFGKYARLVHHRRLTSVLDAIPQQLGQKFSFVRIDRDERAAALRQAVDLLALARVCHRVHHSPARGLPLAAGLDPRTFKCAHLDVGLATAALGLDLTTFEKTDDPLLVNRGAIAEQAVGQLLRLTFPGYEEPQLFWWQREQRGSEAELDYVHAFGARVVPIEVKSGATGTLKSLHGFMASTGFELAIRVNAAPPVVQVVDAVAPGGNQASYRLLSVPLYLTELLPQLIAGAE